MKFLPIYSVKEYTTLYILCFAMYFVACNVIDIMPDIPNEEVTAKVVVITMKWIFLIVAVKSISLQIDQSGLTLDISFLYNDFNSVRS